MKVLRNAAIYVLSSAINASVGFLLLPVLTRYLSPEAYGHVAIFTMLVSFAAPLVGMSMQFNIAREFFSKSKGEIGRIVSNLLFVLTLNSVLVLGAAFVAVALAGSVSGIPSPWVQLVVLIAASQAAMQFVLTILRNLGHAVRFGLFQVALILTNIGISVVLVVQFGLGWQGRATGLLVSSVVVTLIGLGYLRRTGYLVWNVDRQRLRDIYRISLPLIPHALAGIAMGMSGRFFLDRLAGKDQVGLYAVAFTLSSSISLVMTAFNQAWSPWLYEQFAALDDVRRRRIVRQTWGVFAALIGLTVVAAVAAPLVLAVMTTREYAAAAPHFGWLMLGFALQGGYLMVMPYLVQAGRTGVLASITVTSALVNMGATYGLIRLQGPIGAAQAMALSYALSFSLVWWQAQRAMPMPWLSGMLRRARASGGTVP